MLYYFKNGNRLYTVQVLLITNFLYTPGDNKYDIQKVFQQYHQAANVSPLHLYRYPSTNFHELITVMSGSQASAYGSLIWGAYVADLGLLKTAT